jgi:hypothetical protein
MGPGKYENVRESQSVLIIIDPIISTRTRSQYVLISKRAGPPSRVQAHLHLCEQSLSGRVDLHSLLHSQSGPELL